MSLSLKSIGRTALFSLLMVASAPLAFAQQCQPGEIVFLVPIGPRCLDPKNAAGPFGVFEWYFNQLYPWALGTASGIAVLMALVGGINIIMSGGDQGKRQEGLDRLKTGMIGLMLLIFSAIILQTLNPLFFK